MAQEGAAATINSNVSEVNPRPPTSFIRGFSSVGKNIFAIDTS